MCERSRLCASSSRVARERGDGFEGGIIGIGIVLFGVCGYVADDLCGYGDGPYLCMCSPVRFNPNPVLGPGPARSRSPHFAICYIYYIRIRIYNIQQEKEATATADCWRLAAGTDWDDDAENEKSVCAARCCAQLGLGFWVNPSLR